MKTLQSTSKAGILCFLLLSSGINVTAQVTEHPHVIKPDTIISISEISGSDMTWDFSGINLNSYQNTVDSDLVHGIDPVPIYEEPDLSALNNSRTGSTKQRSFTEEGITMLRHGSYDMKLEGTGTLKTSGMIFTGVNKVKLTERYFHSINGNDLVTFVNTYYLFFKADTKELLFSVFYKKRNLNQLIGSEFNGIEFNKAKELENNPGENPLQLSLSPNPAGMQTELSYTLINHAIVTVEVFNQNNTITNLIYTGNSDAGLNHLTIPLNAYSTGSYTVKLTVNGVIYATTLIVE